MGRLLIPGSDVTGKPMSLRWIRVGELDQTTPLSNNVQQNMCNVLFGFCVVAECYEAAVVRSLDTVSTVRSVTDAINTDRSIHAWLGCGPMQDGRHFKERRSQAPQGRDFP